MSLRQVSLSSLALITVFALLAGPADAQKKRKKKHTRNEGIPLVWFPTSDYDLDSVDFSQIEDVSIRVEPFEDARREGSLIGKNIEDDEPKLFTTPDDVAAFVTTHFADSLYRLGFTTVESGGDVAISGEVRRFFVQEDSVYKADVLLQLKLKRGGVEVLNTVRRGTATRWGGSYEKENFYKTVSDAIVHMSNELAESEEFRKALGADTPTD